MKRILFCLLGLLLIAQPNAQAQKKCGFADQMKTLNALNPAFSSYINARKATLQQKADNYKLAKLHSANKTTSFPAAVPVIFHIVIDSAQYNEIGGLAGIKQRCDSQIAVLNRDYNAQNPDAALIPSGWLPYYGNAGINFGLARLSPTGTRVEGYEIKIISASGIDTGSYPGYIYP